MKQTFLIIFVLGAILFSCSNDSNRAATGAAQEVKEQLATANYSVINEGSHLTWRAVHFGGLRPRFGKIHLKSADVSVNEGQLANATIEMDMASLTVESLEEGSEAQAKLVNHLKSDDFFDVKEYEESTFKLVNIETTEGEFNSKVTGNLTIMDITKSISFMANVTVMDDKLTIQSEKFSINRLDWNLSYNKEGTESVALDHIIADDIELMIDVALGKS